MATQKRTDLDIEHFRARLQEEKAAAEQAISGTQSAEGLDSMNEAGTGRAELSDVDNHPADVATELFLLEEDQALVKNAQEILVKIERAMAKMEEGTYGLSDISGEPIPAERLEAIPYATTTADEEEVEEGV